MRNAIIIGALVLVVGAFIVGSFKGNEEDREDAREKEGAQNFQAFKIYTTGDGCKQAIEAIKATVPEAERADFYKNATSSTLPPATCEQIANDIFDSKGYAMDDDENKVMGALRQLTSLLDLWKCQIFFEKIFSKPSNLISPAVIYINVHDPGQKNIIGYLQNFLDDAEQTECADILKKLPMCIVKGKKYNLVTT